VGRQEPASHARAERSRTAQLSDTGGRIGEQLFELGFSLLERPWPPVLVVELEEVEGVEERLPVMGAAMQLVEHGDTGLIATESSPSIVRDAARSAATAAQMRGYRSVQSKPLWVNRRTLRSRLRAMSR
jgi:hypothetical protein